MFICRKFRLDTSEIEPCKYIFLYFLIRSPMSGLFVGPVRVRGQCRSFRVRSYRTSQPVLFSRDRARCFPAKGHFTV